MKRTFRQSPKPPYDFVEVVDEAVPARRDGLLYNDRIYDGLRADDGTDISSRSRHRDYMRQNGLTTMDDFAGEWAKARQQRDDYFTGKRGSISRSDIERAIHQLEKAPRK
jgi:hypothetical protein